MNLNIKKSRKADSPGSCGGHLVNGYGGKRRRTALVGLTLAAMLMMCVGTAALRPSSAKAWAWEDNCTMFVFNKTGQQSSVHPILYTPVLPNTSSLAEYAAYAITGIPTSGAAAFVNTGYPVPSYGCHAFMNFTTPGPTASCKMSAPTTGANTFSCEGNASTKIIRDDDDIAGNVFIPSGSGASAPTPDEPKTGDAALRSGALPGDGWKQSEKITDFGIVGKLMEEGDLPNECDNRGKEATPNVVSSEELIRAGGDEGVGAVVSTYDSAAQAKKGLDEVISDQSIDCLAKLLNSRDTKVAVQPLPTEEGGIGGDQLVISRSGDGGFRAVAYLNVAGWTDGNEAAVEMYETVGAAPSEADEAEATNAVRIGS